MSVVREEVGSAEAEGDDGWVLNVQRDEEIGDAQLLVDSGAAVHCCPGWFATKYGVPVAVDEVRLRGAQGSKITVEGHARVRLVCQGQKLSVTFVVCEVVKPILSVAALQAAGCKVHFGDGAAYISRQGSRLNLVRRGELYYLPVAACATIERSAQGATDIEDLYESDWAAVVDAPKVEGHDAEDARTGRASEHVNGGVGAHGEREQVCDDVEDEAAHNVKVAKAVQELSPEQRRLHEVTHLPYQPWCVACVAGRGLAAQHRRGAGHVEGADAVVQVDYGFVDVRAYVAAVCTVTNTVLARFVVGK